MSDDKPQKNDRYRDTVFLPKTSFAMKAGLPQREPELLKRWAEIDLYNTLRQQSAGRPKYVLHDGPPYANGHLHIGHALNKILKDIVTRSRQMQGFDSNYVPGWDCHGLPIEWKIEEQYREKGRNKDDVPVVEFRQECREFAAGWVDIQREEFKRLGVQGNWADPYLTMNFHAERVIAGWRRDPEFADARGVPAALGFDEEDAATHRGTLAAMPPGSIAMPGEHLTRPRDHVVGRVALEAEVHEVQATGGEELVAVDVVGRDLLVPPVMGVAAGVPGEGREAGAGPAIQGEEEGGEAAPAVRCGRIDPRR